jgi:raffinose/stachyose/melibiose transport system permease protein
MNIKTLLHQNSISDYIAVWVMRIVLLLTVVFSIYPIIFVILTSLKSTSGFLSNIWSLPQTLQFDNYVTAWFDGHVSEYFLNSIIVTLVSLFFLLLFSICAGYALAKLNVPLGELFVAALFIILILPTESMVMPLYIIMTKVHIINLRYIPMVLAYIGWCMPFSIIVLKNFFQTVPSELLEASRIDGATELQTLWKVVAPLMTPALGTCTVFNFCWLWGELMWAQISTSAVSRGLTLTCGLITFQGQYATDWGPMCAAISIIMVPLIIIFLFLQKYFVKGLTAGAVKG